MTRLGLVSDVHHCAWARPGQSYHNPYDIAGALGRLRAALHWFASEQVAAVILDGDLTELGDARSLTEVIDSVATVWDGPALVVPGNHDATGRPEALLAAVREAGRGCVEIASPLGSRFGRVRVAGVDRVDRSVALSPGAWGTGLVVVASHYPLISRVQVVQRNGLEYAGDQPDRERTLAGVLGRPGTIVVNGHLHVRETHTEGGILQLSVGALVEPPFEATLLDVDTDAPRPTLRRRAARMAESVVDREPVLAPADETWILHGTHWVRAGS